MLVWHFGGDIFFPSSVAPCRKSVAPIECPELTTVGSVETPKSSISSSIGVSSLLQQLQGKVQAHRALYHRCPPPPSCSLLMGVLCYLCSDGNLELSDAVLELPVFVPLSKCAGIIRCVES
ncbi:hypothetical protein GW17_00060007 [Ensete ventricosum]|nr:hypothetical protein GW17_00060007 [Ensete ventricosum]